jgi:hypothetical protein
MENVIRANKIICMLRITNMAVMQNVGYYILGQSAEIMEKDLINFFITLLSKDIVT